MIEPSLSLFVELPQRHLFDLLLLISAQSYRGWSLCTLQLVPSSTYPLHGSKTQVALHRLAVLEFVPLEWRLWRKNAPTWAPTRYVVIDVEPKPSYTRLESRNPLVLVPDSTQFLTPRVCSFNRSAGSSERAHLVKSSLVETSLQEKRYETTLSRENRPPIPNSNFS